MGQKEVRKYRRRNRIGRMIDRLKHPWPFYVRSGAISAVVKRANGEEEDLGEISTTYRRRGRGMIARLNG